MKRKASWQACALASLCAGFLAGALVMWMAWNHNPQCEIHCAEQGIDWGYWLALGGGRCAGNAVVHGAAAAA